MKMNLKQSLYISILAGFFFLVPMSVTNAEATCPPNTKPEAGICVPTKDFTNLSDKTFTETLFFIAKRLLAFLAAFTILMIVGSGLMYIMSSGDQERTAKAKNWLMYSIIGLSIALLSYVIVYAVGQMLGLSG